jgi:uncharacterized protein (TIGR01777 family)
MKVFLTGGTGFVGRHLVRALLADGVECVVVSRGGQHPWDDERVRVLRGDPTKSGPWQAAVAGADAVVNLAGAVIVDPPYRWTEARKAMLRTSRTETTYCVVEAMRAADQRPRVLVSMSAIGYYGSRGNAELDETAPPGQDFLASLCVEWEQAARSAQDVARVAILRAGMVLGPDGGVLERLLPPFRLGVGGPWGSGKQWWSWIHVADLVGLIRLLLEREVWGAVNATTPQPVQVAEFARVLGQVLGRPAFTRMPEVALRVALGEAADALVSSLRVLPHRARDAGYAYQFPELAAALADVVRR